MKFKSWVETPPIFFLMWIDIGKKKNFFVDRMAKFGENLATTDLYT